MADQIAGVKPSAELTPSIESAVKLVLSVNGGLVNEASLRRICALAYAEGRFDGLTAMAKISKGATVPEKIRRATASEGQ